MRVHVETAASGTDLVLPELPVRAGAPEALRGGGVGASRSEEEALQVALPLRGRPAVRLSAELKASPSPLLRRSGDSGRSIPARGREGDKRQILARLSRDPPADVVHEQQMLHRSGVVAR